MTDPVQLLAIDADIVGILAALCVCGDTVECTYCDARKEIETGRRTMALAQQDLARARVVINAARALVHEVDRKHNELPPHNALRYTVPWGKVTELRAALEALGS